MFGRRKANNTKDEPAIDPMTRARQMSDVVFDTFVKPMKLQRGLPSPVIAAMLGTLAGHAAQQAALHGLATQSPDYKDFTLVTVDGSNGDRYYFGDAINRPVLEWTYSVWALVGGVLKKMDVPFPDITEVVGHVASTVGSESFGVLRDLPQGAPTVRSLLSLWSAGEALSRDVPHPDYVPVTFALAYQRLAQTDNQVDPSVDQVAMARIMMESTLAASKLIATPADLGQL